MNTDHTDKKKPALIRFICALCGLNGLSLQAKAYRTMLSSPTSVVQSDCNDFL
jgi:hypothetical protein